jgi:hypothetical protein
MKASMERKCHEMMCRFIADISDQEAGRWLVTHGKQVAAFFENGIDGLTKNERMKLYGLMEGFFPKHFERVLATQLSKENDVDCLKLLQAISDIPPVLRRDLL